MSQAMGAPRIAFPQRKVHRRSACLVASIVFFGFVANAEHAAAAHAHPSSQTRYRLPTEPKLKILHAFGGGSDGALPAAALVLDESGALYGTTQAGGLKNMGTAYKLTSSSSGYTESVLHPFTGGKQDGALPSAALTIDATSGTLYGTTAEGGVETYKKGCFVFHYRGCGTVFRLTPAGSAYTESILYKFRGPSSGDGSLPFAGLTRDGKGALYGASSSGGSDGLGAVFKLTPTRENYREGLLFSFPFYSSGPAGVPDGYLPSATLLADDSGNLYGTTPYGGNCPAQPLNGCGVVFKLTPSRSGPAFDVIYTFLSGSDGFLPFAGLVADRSGALYGTTEYGGAANDGVVFKLTPSGSGYTESILYAFQGGNDGALPLASLVLDKSGALYGTTTSGGIANVGTIFKLTPSSSGYTEHILYAFLGGNDGSDPVAGLIFGKNGVLYGTTQSGGASGVGTVFALKQ